MDYISFETAMSLTGMAKSTLWRAIREGRVRHIVAKRSSGHAKARIDLESVLPLLTFEFTEEDRSHILAADAGDADSALQLALNFLEAGRPERAVPWLTKAAESGVADAMCHLGQCYAFGHGVPRDEETAKTWLLTSAEHRHPLARLFVANLRKMRE